MSRKSQSLWTIDDLDAAVAQALAVNYNGPPNKRVRGVPDLRTIRYYTTLGLIDRPAEMRGRTALYGRRHLLQLVAIKRFQEKGLSLANIQSRLIGISNSELEKLAKVKSEIEIPSMPLPDAATGAERRDNFWLASTAPVEKNHVSPASVQNPFQGISLEEQIMLLLAADRPVTEEDIQAIRAAAGPLIEALQSRGLRPNTNRREL